ncbi:TPA: hypothetical protein HA259_06940, partial [Thermoplasmata archaeon]|nr:hypothetical protein [Thermoplasmata archaeon]
MKGFHGKILKVDLGEEKSSVKTVDERYVRKYLGGQGFAVELVYHDMPVGTDA